MDGMKTKLATPPLGLFATLLILALPGDFIQSALSADSADTRISIEVKGGSLSINGVKLSEPWSTEELIKIMGNPSRMMLSVQEGGVAGMTDDPRRANQLVWDDYGILADRSPVYPRPTDNESAHWADPVRMVAITLIRDLNAPISAPKTPFQGSLIVDGGLVSPEATIDEINRERREQAFVAIPKDILKLHERDVDGLSVRLMPTKDSAASGGAHFRRVFIGPSKGR